MIIFNADEQDILVESADRMSNQLREFFRRVSLLKDLYFKYFQSK